jgi:hypothetical protein
LHHALLSYDMPYSLHAALLLMLLLLLQEDIEGAIGAMAQRNLRDASTNGSSLSLTLNGVLVQAGHVYEKDSLLGAMLA